MLIIVDFGFNLSVAKKISYLQPDSPELPGLFWKITVIKLLICLLLVCIVIALFEICTTLYIYKSAVYISFFSIIGSVFYPAWLFMGLNQVKKMSVINASAKLLALPLIFFLVKSPSDYLQAVWLHSLTYVLSGIISLCAILPHPHFRVFSLRELNWRGIIDELKTGWPIFLSNATTSMYTSSLTVILGFYTNAGMVGIFSAVERIIRMLCFGIYVPLNQAAFPVLARLSNEDFRKALFIFKLLFYFVLCLTVIICIAVILNASMILNFLSEYKFGSIILQVGVITIIPISLGGICGQLGLIALGGHQHKKIFSRIYMTIGLMSIPLTFTAIMFYTINGAIFSMMVTEFAIFIAMFIAVRKFKLM
jgi:PST family polysaccharide transporter